MPVEGRDDEVIVLTIVKPFASYNEGEVAAFLPEQAERLIEEGNAVEGGADAPPVNLTAPYAEQAGGDVTSTMGNWAGEPTDYAYQWKRDGTDIATATAATYMLAAADAGTTLTCVVTATNANGSTASPPSNGVAVAAADDAGSARHGRRTR